MPKEQIIKENEILKMELYRRQKNGLIDELR